MTVKLSSVRRDPSRDRDGDWIDSQVLPGVSFKVRSIHYPAYTIARDELMQKLRRQAGAKPIPQDTLVGSLGLLYAEHLLLDWKGFDEAYSAEVAREMLSDPLCNELILAVENAAGVMGQANLEFIKDTAKNSAAPSVTS